MRYEPLIRQTFQVMGQSGDEFVCKCPWHDDRGKPNLYVNGVKGVYLCHACGAKGHLSSISKEIPEADTTDVRRRLKSLQAEAPVPRYYSEGWLKQYDFHHPYWTETRGFSDATIERFNLGYDPIQNLCTIPIRDRRNHILGVITRRLDNERPKYLDPKGLKKGKHLFGAWLVRSRHRRVALVEGPLDCVSCWDARVPAMALMGARITEDQVLELLRLGIEHVVLMMDNDRAGHGFPVHRSSRRGQCDVCGRPGSSKGDEHPATGTFQVHDALRGTGIIVSVGNYRPYWFHNGRPSKDPGDLTPAQRRKMFHSAKGWHDVQNRVP